MKGRIAGLMHAKNTIIMINFAIIVTLSLVVFRNWLFTAEWPGGGDILGWISKAYVWQDFRWLFVWRHYSFGFVESAWIDLKDLLLVSLYSLTENAAVVVKSFMFSFFLIAGFSIYAFTYRYTHHHLGALSASLIYMLNPWFFSQFTEAHLDIVFCYALAPFIFLIVDRTLERGKCKDVLFSALGIWVILTAFHLQYVVIYGFFLALFVLFYIFFPNKCRVRTQFERAFKLLIPACVIALFLSAYLIMPLFSRLAAPYLSPEYGFPLEKSYITSYGNLGEAFTLSANEQFGYSSIVDFSNGLSLPDFPISSFLLYLFIMVFFAVLIFVKIDRYIAFFACSTLLAIFISKGPNSPFGYLFEWAWFNVPYFSVLRAASRWNAMTAFSVAFFASIVTSRLTIYLQKIRKQQSLQFFGFKMKTQSDGQFNEVIITSNTLDRIGKAIRKLVFMGCIILLACILLSGFLANSFALTQGLQVYTPPSQYLQPFQWIAEQHGNYKVVTVGSSMYIGDASATTDLGWGHDIGYESYFIDDKPTLQEGGLEPLSRAFVGHIQNYLVPNNLTDNLSEMLGTFNYRYTVIPPYAYNASREFFLNQEGVRAVSTESSLVLENNYTPPLFATDNEVIVVGGLESLYSLLTVESFSLNRTAVLFADQLWEDPSTLRMLLDTSQALIMVDSDPMDLVMLSLRDKCPWIDAASYGVRSINDTQYWIQSSEWKDKGKLVLGGYTLRASSENSISIPFHIDAYGSYEVWIRLGFGPSQGTLSLSIDKKNVANTQAYQALESVGWLNVASLNLTSGDHIANLQNVGGGLCDIDIITFAESSLLESETQRIFDTVRNIPGRCVYFFQAEDLFAAKLPKEWTPVISKYNGLTLFTEGIGHNISPEGNASSSSVAEFDAKYGIDENFATRWASQPGVPQWFQVEWDVPRLLTGVRLYFERAVAEDYAVQTWDGTNWVTQIEVTGNNELERVHIFEQTVQATELRIYVTKASAFNMVSIWELECYSPEESQLSANIYVSAPKRFMVGLRVASDNEQTYLSINIGNSSATFPISSESKGFNWYETGPYELGVGDNKISISASGEILLDSVVLYSLRENEEALPIKDMIAQNDSPASVEFDIIDPCRYNVHIKCNVPSFLVFSEAYHPLWEISTDDTDVYHTIAYSFLNGFLINKTGEFDLVLSFEGQTYANMGIAISTVTFAVVIMYSISHFTPFKYFIRKPRNIFKRLLKSHIKHG